MSRADKRDRIPAVIDPGIPGIEEVTFDRVVRFWVDNNADCDADGNRGHRVEGCDEDEPENILITPVCESCDGSGCQKFCGCQPPECATACESEPCPDCIGGTKPVPLSEQADCVQHLILAAIALYCDTHEAEPPETDEPDGDYDRDDDVHDYPADDYRD